MQEVTVQSWGSRLKDSLVGILFGFILIGIAIYLIFWNENHSLIMARSLSEACKVLISVPPSPIDSKNNLRVIYVSGLATTNNKLQDPLLNADLVAIALIRKVEMYQWQQEEKTRTEKQLGGSERTIKSYIYNKVWSENLINSSQFKENNYQNPVSMPVHSGRQVASSVTLGDFTLPPALVDKITATTPVDLSQVDLDKLTKQFNKPVRLINNELYLGQDIQNPQIGDLRISLSAVLPQAVSIIAQQVGTTLQAYHAKAGEDVLLLSPGQVSHAGMIREAQDENRMTMWSIRLVTLVMVIMGFALLMRPLAVLADVIPFVGTIIGFGTGLIAVVLGICLWAIFLAIAWFTTRPFFAMGLLIIVVLVIYLLWKSRADKMDNNDKTISNVK
ncbi:TMEM43 family protein [Legionella gresilensis]|uniref:TMEM43 family protein n=1 Tax=Legionella gresilensis TaxID=91823 RepID=UPI001040FC31|nr:TMEM43 family protein [Legionella gresilensis]